MAYEDLTYLQRKAESLRQPRYGIAQILRDRKADKIEQQLAEGEKRNQQNQQQELAAILKGRQTGRVGDSYASRPIDQYTPSDPELRKLLAQQLLGRTSDPSDLERYMAMSDADRAAALEFRRNPYLNQGDQYTNVTTGETMPINVRPDNLPSTRGAQAAAVQSAEIAAIPERVATQTAADRAAQLPQAQNRLATQQRQATLVDDFIDQAEELASGWTTGMGGALLSDIPNTPAHDLAAVIETIEANIGFDKLQEMRNNSPTGGALGSITDPERRALNATMGSLKQSQSPEQFKQNLETIREQVRAIVHGSEQQFQQTYGGQGGSVIESADEILRRAGIIQ